MDPWAEQHGHRARGQAGFRRGRSCTDNIFILRHTAEKYTNNGGKLYCCFIDFRKAYDLIIRTRLWARLKALGMHGRMLSAVQSMYAQVEICARVRGELSESFASNVGVKQGDPLSPLLFGLFIDAIDTWLVSQVDETHGVYIGPELILHE